MQVGDLGIYICIYICRVCVCEQGRRDRDSARTRARKRARERESEDVGRKGSVRGREEGRERVCV